MPQIARVQRLSPAFPNKPRALRAIYLGEPGARYIPAEVNPAHTFRVTFRNTDARGHSGQIRFNVSEFRGQRLEELLWPPEGTVAPFLGAKNVDVLVADDASWTAGQSGGIP